MKIFLMVYKTQNITQAAGMLHITQPAVTRAIQEIEQYYGVRLFERINRRLSVTEAGRQLYGQALHIVGSFEELEQGLRRWNEQGILRVGSSITFGNFLMPQVAAECQKRFPDLKLYVNISNGACLQQMILDNQLDFALIEGEVTDENLVKEQFASDQLVMLLPPGHPLTVCDKIWFKDLEGQSFLMRENGSAGRDFLNHIFAVHEVPLKPVWESASTQAIVKAVHAGLGIAFLPEPLVKHDIETGYVLTRTVEDETFHRKNYMIWHRNKYLTDAAKNLMELCRQYASGGGTKKNLDIVL
jgi:DNA-binding transcriptional LysR family regulator